MSWEFKWRAYCVRVIDGDTIDLMLDKGFRDMSLQRIRLAGINCPERHTTTRAAGDAAMLYTKVWIAQAGLEQWPLTITTYKTDSFDRYVAVITRNGDPTPLNDALLQSGNAVPFMVDKVQT